MSMGGRPAEEGIQMEEARQFRPLNDMADVLGLVTGWCGSSAFLFRWGEGDSLLELLEGLQRVAVL
jgi:hypothetical protein